MMMLQYIVLDPNMGVHSNASSPQPMVYPSPPSSLLAYIAPFVVEDLRLVDQMGRIVLIRGGLNTDRGTIDIAALPSGPYVLELRAGERQVRCKVSRE